MASKNFTLYLYYVESLSGPDSPFFKLTDTAGMEDHDWLLVEKVTVTRDLSDMQDLTAQRLAMLEKQKAELREKFVQAIRLVDERIQSLLAIENGVVDAEVRHVDA